MKNKVIVVVGPTAVGKTKISIDAICLAKEVDFISQYSEEYVIMDTVPTNMDLSKKVLLYAVKHFYLKGKASYELQSI